MESGIQEKNGDLYCKKHKKEITMFLMDQQVPFKDTLLCPQCFEEKPTISQKMISLSKAKQMIQEQSLNSNQNFSWNTQPLVNDLKSFATKLKEYQQQVIQTIDQITGIILKWIKDIDDVRKPYNINILQRLQELHENNNDHKNQEQIIENIRNIHYNKLLTNFNKLYNQEKLIECDYYQQQFLNQKQQQVVSGVFVPSVDYSKNKQIIKIQEETVVSVAKKCIQISAVKQTQDCRAIAFNKTGSIMVAGCNKEIKVWNFEKGNLREIFKLGGHTDQIRCLVFSKNINLFISGSDDKMIRGWKEQQNGWGWFTPKQQHSNSVFCLLLNINENQLISGSADKTIKVWNLDFINNQIQFNYKLDNKHRNEVNSISLNKNETSLVSCSNDKTIILWIKGQNQKWEYANHIEGYFGYRICFVTENQFLFQPVKLNQTKIFKIENKRIVEQLNLQINLKDENDDNFLFPTIYNKKREVIIQKHGKYVYILQKQADRSLKIALEPIDCKSQSNYGSLTEDGEFLVIWNYDTNEFRVHYIFY